MLDYNEILPKKIIDIEGEPYMVLASHVFRKQQRKPVNQTTLKHLKTGKVTERSFHQNETIPEADIETKTLVYIYTQKGESWFHNVTNKSERYMIPSDTIEHELLYLKANTEVTALFFNEALISITIPVKMELLVADTPPNVKGNSVQGGNKIATLESGAAVTVPMFINVGDMIRVNTDSNEYVERVEKA
jgi:elongation factor P